MSFDLAARCAAYRNQRLYRRRLTLESAQQPIVTLEGRTYLAFCSNDYLGLAHHPEVVAALREGAQRWGVGSGASRLVVGHSEPHERLEARLAQWTRRPRALLFSSGYMANLAAIATLLDRHDTLLQDRLNHASLLDAGRLSRACLRRYRHNDIAHLGERLQTTRGDTLIATDGVFSMDGDIACLPQICALAKTHDAWTLVDDAHGFGVLGEHGGGTIEHFGLTLEQVPVLIGTLGKALGTAGAFIAGSEALIETLIQFARPYIYTTGQPPALAHATLRSLQLVDEENWRRTHLQSLIRLFRDEARARGLPLAASRTPIQPLQIGDNAKALGVSAALRAQGILVSAIRPPTVPAGSARLRITLTAAHTQAHVEQLLQALTIAWRSFDSAGES